MTKFIGPILVLDDVGEFNPAAPLLPPGQLGLYRRGNSIYTRIGAESENMVENGNGTAIGSAVGGATPYTLLYTDGSGNLGNSGSLSLSQDYNRLLLDGALDDGSSSLQLNGSLTFQAGVIGSLAEPAQVSIAYTGQIIMGTGPTGPVTIHFVGGANDGVSISATGYASSDPACTVYFLSTPPPSVPQINDTYRLSLSLLSPLYTVGQDSGGFWYYPFVASGQPASWVPGPNSGAFTNGSRNGTAVNLYFQTLTGSIFVVFISVPRGISPNPAGTSTEMSASAFTAIDPINRLLIAKDGGTTNMDWSQPGRILINGATDDGNTNLQVNNTLSSGFIQTWNLNGTQVAAVDFGGNFYGIGVWLTGPGALTPFSALDSYTLTLKYNETATMSYDTNNGFTSFTTANNVNFGSLSLGYNFITFVGSNVGGNPAFYGQYVFTNLFHNQQWALQIPGSTGLPDSAYSTLLISDLGNSVDYMRFQNGLVSVLGTNNFSVGGAVTLGAPSTTPTHSINTATGTPTNTVTPAGYVMATINGTTGYFAYYQ